MAVWARGCDRAREINPTGDVLESAVQVWNFFLLRIVYRERTGESEKETLYELGKRGATLHRETSL